MPAGIALDPEEQAFGEIAGELGFEDFAGGAADIVGEPVVGEDFFFGLKDAVAGAVVVVARLSDASDGDDVFFVVFEGEDGAEDFFGAKFGVQAEGFGEMGVADEGDLAEFIPVVDELVGLVEIEDVFEFFGVDGGAVGEHDVFPGGGVGEGAQPLVVFFAQVACVPVECFACGVVVEGVVHAAAYGGVVVAEDGCMGVFTDQVAAGVGVGSVANDVAQANEHFQGRVVLGVGFDDGGECFEIGVNVAENSDVHGGDCLRCGTEKGTEKLRKRVFVASSGLIPYGFVRWQRRHEEVCCGRARTLRWFRGVRFPGVRAVR